MSHYHEIFEELEAFDPLWHMNYHSMSEAIEAAAHGAPYVIELYEDYLSTPEGLKYLENIASTRDYLAEFRAAQRAEEESSLPFKLSNIGKVPYGS